MAVTCRELVELVTDYLEEALERGDRVVFEAHVAQCGGCAAYLEQMRTTMTLVGATRDVRPATAPRGLLEAFRHWSGVSTP